MQKKICYIILDNSAKYFALYDESLSLKENDWCVIRKDFYQDYGRVERLIENLSDKLDVNEMPQVIRKATVNDKGKANENHIRAKSAFRTAQKQVEVLKLEMNLLNAHYSFDCKQLQIQFTADGRIDFRQLVKDLAKILNTRIELRQIGVRDETAIYGGIGVCGQEICCHRFLKEFDSINVKMAKDQDLPLTPSSISGICGRLKCCLKYEHDGYLELEKTMPRRGDVCECAEGRGRICDRNLLTQNVTVRLDETGATVSCPRDEVRVVYPEKYKMKKNKQDQDQDENNEEIKKLED